MLWLALVKPLVAVFKPVVVLWAGLNALDDLSRLMRLARLGSVILPGTDKTDLCDVCDDVMGDLLTTGGIDDMPCRLMCLRIPACVQMCENVKAVSANSSHFPCMAAGYCDAVEEGLVESDVECNVAPILRCEPKRYCKRVRHGLKMSCELKPGLGRWVGMKNAVSNHAGAIADGLLSQPFCGEEGAGPYCIAHARGMGAVAEGLGHVLSLLYGGWQTVLSIETPGGDDDRQWLTFWLVLTLLLFLERFLARVLLSTFPFYYELKLALLVWLMLGDGADALYRKLRRAITKLLAALPFLRLRFDASQRAYAASELDCLKKRCPDLVAAALADTAKRRKAPTAEPAWLRAPGAGAGEPAWYEEEKPAEADAGAQAELEAVSAYVLTPEGGAALAKSGMTTRAKETLLEAASARASFHPRFVNAYVVGVPASPPHAALPTMDSSIEGGLCDAYVKCRVIDGADGAAYPKRGVCTRPRYRTLRPLWRHELELPLRGGRINSNGLYRNEGACSSTLQLQVFDADVGVWGWLLYGAELALVSLGVLAVVGFVLGYVDDLSRGQMRAFEGAAAAAALLLCVSYIVHVVHASDDDPVGEAAVPLSLLIDQKEHTLLLRLSLPPDGSATDGAKAAAAPDRGIIKVVLWCSER